MTVFNSLGALNVARNDARQAYHQAMYEFDKKPSASNWNKLTYAMYVHQNLQQNVRKQYSSCLNSNLVSLEYYTL